MTALVMQKLATALLNEGFVVKKIEDETVGSFDRKDNGEKYTGQLILTIRPVDEEEAEAEAAQLRKAGEREKAKSYMPNKPREEGPEF